MECPHQFSHVQNLRVSTFCVFCIIPVSLPQDLLTIYISITRSVLGYCCAVWSTSISLYFSDKIKRVEHYGLQILYSNMSYSPARATSSLPHLSDRRDILCKVLNKIATPSSCLNHLLPPAQFWSHGRELHRPNNFSLNVGRTDLRTVSFQLCSYILQ